MVLWSFIGEGRIDQTSGKMYQKRNLSEELKHQLRNGTMTNRLIIANVSVFLLIHLLLAIGRKFKLPIIALGMGEKEDDLQTFNAEYFANALMSL